MSAETAAGPRRPARLEEGLAALAVTLPTIVAYLDSFSGVMVFDDIGSILENPTLRHLGDLGRVLMPPGNGTTVGGRPLLNLTFAVNYALGGTNPLGYHAVNLAIHVGSGLLLMGIARRTALSWAGATARCALWTGAALALLWAVHPMATEAVTYIAQRAESLVGFFYLLTLYCFIRYTRMEHPAPVLPGQARTEPPSFVPRCGTSEGEQAGKRPWAWISIGACLLAAATKEGAVSAPVIVLLYDRTFLSGCFAQALRLRWRFHAALASSWILLGWLALRSGDRGGSVPLVLAEAPPYWLTQIRAVVHYLRLAFWPHPLVLDYGTRLTPDMQPTVPAAILVAALAAGTVLALVRPGPQRSRRRMLGFLGAFFFAILAPTSLLPLILQVMSEHRAYLALIAVLAAAIVALRPVLARLDPRLILAAVVVLATSEAWGTVRRNGDYRSELSLWRQNDEAWPANPRVKYDVGLALWRNGDAAGAASYFGEAVRLKPDYPNALINLGNALDYLGRHGQAAAALERAVQLDPESDLARYDLGLALLAAGRGPEAIKEFSEALRLNPDLAPARQGLVRALLLEGRIHEARMQMDEARRRESGGG
jgi:protein O-mannosyl-transferase